MLKVINFCSLHLSEGGSVEVEEYVIDEKLDESVRGFLYYMFGLYDEYSCSDVSEEDEVWSRTFGYCGDYLKETNDEDYDSYVEYFNKNKVDFLSKRKNEKLIEWSVEYDMSIGFVVDDRVDEVVKKLKELKEIDDVMNDF